MLVVSTTSWVAGKPGLLSFWDAHVPASKTWNMGKYQTRVAPKPALGFQPPKFLGVLFPNDPGFR